MRKMFSQKQIEEMIARGQVALVVGNVKELNDEQCENLKCGDVVVRTTDNQKHAYIVTYKENGVGICLSYFDASCIETQSYDYTDGHWVYNSEDKTTFADINQLPDVSASDNGKVLEVLAGVWGKGEKKVNVINAPSSTTLTDEQIAQITEGRFVNGDIGTLHNPVFFPARESTTAYFSYFIGANTGGNQVMFGGYIINKTSKILTTQTYFQVDSSEKLSIFNVKNFMGKAIPNYPDNTGTFTLKCVDGVLTWVQDV